MKIDRSTNASMLLGYLEGDLSASERTQVEERLANSGAERRSLDELRCMRARLLAARCGPHDVDLVEGVHRRARERQRARRAERARGFKWPFTLASAAAVALAVGSLWTNGAELNGFSRSTVEETAEFRAKSSELEATREWVGVQIYQVGSDGKPRRVSEQIEQGTGLLFSYVNVSSSELGYLMIFAVDALGHVVWIHPARDATSGDATSLRIERSGRQVTIPELIRPELRAGELRIYAAFTRSALQVGEVERWLADHPGEGLVLPPGAGRLEVTPVRVVP